MEILFFVEVIKKYGNTVFCGRDMKILGNLSRLY